MKVITIIVMLVVSHWNPLLSQQAYDVRHTDYYEVKAGTVANGHAMSLGIAGKFYGTNNFTIVPEVTLLGGPFLCGTLRYDIPFDAGMRITPQLGIGLLPLPLFLITTGIAGVDISYHPSSEYYLFLEARVYGFATNGIISIGSGSFAIERPNPIVLSAGIAF